MKVTITVEGIERTFQGDYYELHCRDWNDRVRDMLDTAQDAEIDNKNA